MMDQAIKDFPKQFAWQPKIENASRLKRAKKFVVLGMGGSNLTVGLLKIRDPFLDIITHKDYGLPAIPDAELKSRLIIASSYSGNTEETIDGFLQAVKKGLPLAVVTTGGKLLELAQKHCVPYIKILDTVIQPRMALGFNAMALLSFIQDAKAIREAHALKKLIKPSSYESEGKRIAKRIEGHSPIIYSSAQNYGIAYNWKIKFNETGKIPAFCNALPELNHNEMTGFDVQQSSRGLSENLAFIFLNDASDHPRVQKRMKILDELYRARGLMVKTLELKGKSVFNKIFGSLVLADWAAFHTAQLYGLEAEQVPMVEEFKKLMKD